MKNFRLGSKGLLGQSLAVGVVVALLVSLGGRAAVAEAYQTFASPQDLLNAMIQREMAAGAKHERYEYTSNERSERTGGHLWTERVVETGNGRLRMLLAEDGRPVSADRAQQEKARLVDYEVHPDAFAKSQAEHRNEEAHARAMLDELPKGFILSNVELQGGVWHMDFRPNPDYSPSGMEEKVLHGMSGWLLIDAKDLRLVHIEGHLASDVTLGFGLVTVHAGSHFLSARKYMDGHWRTVHVVSDIRGKAIIFKSISRNTDLTRSDFKYLDQGITLAQAVDIVQR